VNPRGGPSSVPRSIYSADRTVQANALRREVQNRIARLHASYIPNLNNARTALQNAIQSGASEAQIAPLRDAERAARRAWNDQMARIASNFRRLRAISPNEPVPTEIQGRV
jgi:hypothetical protein